METWNGYEIKLNRNKIEYAVNKAGKVVAKRCTGKGCNEILYIDMFYSRKTGFAGKHAVCKSCHEKQCSETPRSKEKAREWRQSNKKHLRNYYYANKDRKKERDHRRRARKKNLPDTLTAEQHRRLQEMQDYKCILTGIPAYSDLEKHQSQFSLEHFIPLEWGNVGGTTFENCYYMYLPSNISKWRRNPFEWIKTQPQEIQENFHNKLVPEMARRNDMTIEEYTAYVIAAYEEYLICEKKDPA